MYTDLIEPEVAKTGDFTLKYKNVYLHSKYNPKREAQQFIEKHYNNASVQILIGYGAGYIYKALQKRIDKNEKIIVIDPIIEPNEDVFYLKSYDSKSIKHFLDEHIHLIDTVNCIVSINYDKIIAESDELERFIKILREKISSNTISENTITFFNSQWNKNYLKNLKYAYTSKSIKDLFSEKDIPVVVASGGPSLTKQLPFVKKYRNKIILVAAGTTINSLLKNNIRPDLVVSVDGGEINYNHFKELQIEDFPLVYCPTLHYGIRSHFKYAYHCFLTLEESLIPHYELFTEQPVDTLIGGSSVAHTAYNLALFLTKGPVALIGQDLAYTNGKSHAEGNLNRNTITNKELLVREGYYGEDVETDSVFLQMRAGFEMIQENMKAYDKSYNCTEGGLKIPTFKQMRFQDFLENYAKKEADINYKYEIVDSKHEKCQNQFKIDVEKHNRLIELFNEALNELNKNEERTYFSAEILKKLEEIDGEIQEKLKESSLSYAFNLVNLRVLRYFKLSKEATLEEKYKMSFKQSEYMYSEMLNITTESLKIIQEL
ncbi:motility associated factor glycosyltransferase family protein [Rummeliibacillus sp. NPDC094406]|uniref:motility associated factor glycosyltransferase family protein n=1 Tax=Rummeliibacillus sp. NPDC094406 TaxID=3364511 RepID=UPI0037F6418B